MKLMLDRERSAEPKRRNFVGSRVLAFTALMTTVATCGVLVGRIVEDGMTCSETQTVLVGDEDDITFYALVEDFVERHDVSVAKVVDHDIGLNPGMDTAHLLLSQQVTLSKVCVSN